VSVPRIERPRCEEKYLQGRRANKCKFKSLATRQRLLRSAGASRRRAVVALSPRLSFIFRVHSGAPQCRNHGYRLPCSEKRSASRAAAGPNVLHR
jgi:hypothetical protein